MIGKKLAVVCFFLVTAMPAFCGFVKNSPTDKNYEDGIYYFRQGDYFMAEVSLNRFDAGNDIYLQEEKEHMLACCSYELNEPFLLIKLNDYVEKYPLSMHSSHIRYLIASSYFRNEDYVMCVSSFAKIDMKSLDSKDQEDALYKEGIACLHVEDMVKAQSCFVALKDYDGTCVQDAIYYLSYIAYVKQNYNEALNGFSVINSGEKYGELSSYYIADCHLKLKNYQKVVEDAKIFIEKYPEADKMPEMKRILGESYYYTGHYIDASNNLQNYADKETQPDRDAMFKLGVSYYKTHVYSKAIVAFDKVTSVNDQLSQLAYYHLGLTYLQMSDKSDARMAFEQSSSMNFDKSIKEEAFYNYTLALKETSYSAFGESITACERFLNEFPNSEYTDKVGGLLVEMYMNTKSYDAALRSINRIKHPGSLILKAKQKILLQLGIDAFVNSRYDQAAKYFDESISLGSYDKQVLADAYYWIGETEYRQKKIDDSEKRFLQYQSFTLNKGDEMYALSYYNLAYIAFNKKQYAKAKNLFDLYLKYKDDNANVLADVYNRMGDCNFAERNFSVANSYYSKAMQVDSSTADYALYQTAFAAGLQKDYQEKINLLNKLIRTYPKSDYQDEALYEKGRAYVMMGDNRNAISAYREFIEKYPSSSQAKTAENEMALLYYQDNQNKNAIDTYKDVIKKYPGSDEANQALHDLRSVYVDMNQVGDYISYVKTVQGGGSMGVNEQDSLEFAAIEKIYQNGNTGQAKSGLENYLKQYPKGIGSLTAHYYLASILAAEQNNKDAAAHAEAVLAEPDNQYTHETQLLYAQIMMSLKEYAKADNVYKDLVRSTTDEEDLQTVRLGWLRSANLAGDNEGVIEAAEILLANKKIDLDLKNEALYCRATAYLKQKNFDKAVADYGELSKDIRNIYGAEAKYQLGQVYYDRKEYAKAEKIMLQYIDESTPHLYWLARSFVLLSDVYVAMDRKIEAKQYLLSLRQNYTKKDDIQEMINIRLKKLK